MRKLVVYLFFGVQIAAICYAKITPERYLSWAPFDQISFFEIKAVVNGQVLSDKQVKERYGLASKGRENRSIHHVFGIISQYEETYGKQDSCLITCLYRVNGSAVKEWKLAD